MVNGMDKGCCRPLGEAESAFFSKEAVLKKYAPFKTLIEKEISAEKPPYLEDFLREANVSSGQKVLEIGINPGYLAIYFAKIVGDSGEVALAELDRIIMPDAEKNIRKHKVSSLVEVTEAKIGRLPFRTNYFDIVLSDRTTSLIKRKSTLIREMVRVLKTEGKLVIADCVLRKPFTKTQVEQFRQDFACIFQAVAIESYADIFESMGLTEIKTILFMDEECVRPHSKIKGMVQGHLGFAITYGKKC
jgi:ubiquinone/menaquinone biosynthesis C-methylase UbiE